MRCGMQDVAGSCMQNAAHASRLSVVNRTVPAKRRSLLSAENTIGPPNHSLLPLVNTTLTAIVHAFCPLITLPCGVACRANCSAISRSSFTELLALRSLSGTHHAELRTVDVNYRGDVRGPVRSALPYF